MLTSRERFRRHQFDHDAVRRIAREEFAVTIHVSLQRKRLRESWGWAQVWPWRFAKIVIDSGHRTVEDALRTLAHELTHVARAERMGYSAFVDEHKDEKPLPAEERPSEIEAIAAEERWAVLLPAIR